MSKSSEYGPTAAKRTQNVPGSTFGSDAITFETASSTRRTCAGDDSRLRLKRGWNHVVLRREKFSSVIAENYPFGTVTIVRSSVRILVERSPICSTNPIRSPNLQ